MNKRVLSTDCRLGAASLRLRRIAVLLIILLTVGSASWAQVIGPPMRISTLSNIENEPDVAVSGEAAIAVWTIVRGNCGHGTAWALSRDYGASWAEEGQLPGEVFGSGQATVCADVSGHFYLARLSCFPGYTVEILRGHYDGSALTWQDPVIAVGAPLDSIQQNRPWIACDPGGAFVYLSYTNNYQQVFFLCSTDSGATWSTPFALSPPTCTGSRPIVGPDGELYVIWQDYAAHQIVGRKSSDHGTTFATPFMIADVPVSQAYLLSWSGNTDRSRPVPPAGCWEGGFPSIAVDGTNGPHRGALYVTWTEQASGTLSSSSGGVGEVEPNDHYTSAMPIQLGQTVYGSMVGGEYQGDCDILTFEAIAGTTLGITGTVTTRARFNPPPDGWGYRLVCAGDTLRPLTCGVLWTLGQAPPLVFTVPETGRYYLDLGCTYPHSQQTYSISVRTLDVSPASVARDHRDVVLVSSMDGGQTWSPKVRVNDDPPRFDNSLPEVAVDGSGNVHVAWYDRREAPECAQLVHTYWSVSNDGGQTFQPSRRVSTAAQDLREIYQQGWRVGDHLAIEVAGDRVLVLWTQLSAQYQIQEYADIYGAVISDLTTGTLIERFTAEVDGAAVRLAWAVGDVPGMEGFRLGRASQREGPYTPVGSGLIAGTGAVEYQIDDLKAAPGQQYWYRLEIVRVAGGSLWAGPVAVRIPAGAARLAWRGATPNPFASVVDLTLEVARGGQGSVRVYDVSGHEVARLRSGPIEPGRLRLRWDGRRRSGGLVAAGVYLVVARVGDETVIGTVMRLP